MNSLESRLLGSMMLAILIPISSGMLVSSTLTEINSLSRKDKRIYRNTDISNKIFSVMTWIVGFVFGLGIDFILLTLFMK
jgi:hypothetical protein